MLALRMSAGSNFQDLSGQTFGRLTALSRAPNQVHRGGGKATRWNCICFCGKAVTVLAHSLTKGNTKSCGCWKREAPNGMTTHGHARGYKRSGTLRTYRAMITRCTNSSVLNFKDYGGRGITVCDRWLGPHGFENFLADMGERPEGLSIDRIENDGNYEPWNCRWATQLEQNRNRRRRQK